MTQHDSIVQPISNDEQVDVYRLLLDAAVTENDALRAENTALRNFCIQQILSKRDRTPERSE